MHHGPFLEFSSPKQQALLLVHLDRLKAASNSDIDLIKNELTQLTTEQFPLSLQKRRVGAYDQYFWRFKSNRGDNKRRFVRLSHEDLEEYLETCSHNFLLQLKRIEEMVIKLNANIKIASSLQSIIDDYNQQLTQLVTLQSALDYSQTVE